MEWLQPNACTTVAAPRGDGLMNTGRGRLYSSADLFDQQCGKLGFAAY